MGVYDRKPKPVRVRTCWFGMTRDRQGPAFWIEVSRRVSAAGVSAKNLEAVRIIVRQVETKHKGK